VNNIQGQVWWRAPGEQKVWKLKQVQEGSTTFRFAPFKTDRFHEVIELTGVRETSDFPHPGSVRNLKMGVEVKSSRSQHEQIIGHALKAIDEGQLEKVVLSQTEFWHTDASAEELFKIKCEVFPNAFVYLIDHPKSGVWLGATPELLIQSSGGGQFRTVALAGTKMDLDEAWTAKEMKEQVLVTQFIEGLLNKEAVKNVIVGNVHDLDYGQIKHLKTEIAFESNRTIEEWLPLLHPTPAVGGYPRNEALEFIEEHEVTPRGYYTGYLGLIESDGLAEFYVNLRCMKCHSNGHRLFAGGGVVEGSTPIGEWEEIQSKIDSIRMELAS